MRHTREFQVSFQGEGKIQTVFFSEESANRLNAERICAFLAQLGQPELSPSRARPGGKRHIWKNSQLWSKVAGAEVAGLIGGMLFPEEARDIAHAKIKERLDRGEGMPDYMKDSMVYYAGPAKTPEGYASGSFGPTTAGRMDAYVDQFQSQGGSFVMLAKGNRSPVVTEACHKYGGFYLGSIGGPAARLAKDCIKKVEVLDPSSGWKPCSASRSSISPRSSWSTTRATTSSRRSSARSRDPARCPW